MRSHRETTLGKFHSAHIVGSFETRSKNLLRTTTPATNANDKVKARIYHEEETGVIKNDSQG